MGKDQIVSKKFYENYYGALDGAIITKVEIREDDDFGRTEYWPVFTVILANGFETELEISRDEEGNGPGFVFGLPSVVANGSK
jgi:hypothetical protein